MRWKFSRARKLDKAVGRSFVALESSGECGRVVDHKGARGAARSSEEHWNAKAQGVWTEGIAHSLASPASSGTNGNEPSLVVGGSVYKHSRELNLSHHVMAQIRV